MIEEFCQYRMIECLSVKNNTVCWSKYKPNGSNLKQHNVVSQIKIFRLIFQNNEFQ